MFYLGFYLRIFIFIQFLNILHLIGPINVVYTSKPVTIGMEKNTVKGNFEEANLKKRLIKKRVPILPEMFYKEDTKMLVSIIISSIIAFPKIQQTFVKSLIHLTAQCVIVTVARFLQQLSIHMQPQERIQRTTSQCFLQGQRK